MKLSKCQLALFWRTFTAAAINAGIPELERDKWRYRILREQAGVGHLAELDRTAGFDKVMAYLSEMAGDYEAAVHYSGGGVRRYRAAIERVARELLLAKGGLEGRDGELIPGVVESYLTGIIYQGRLVHTRLTERQFALRLADGAGWDDLTELVLRLILQIVNSQARKVRRA